MPEIEKPAHAAHETPFDETLEEHREIRRNVQELKDLLSEYRVGMEPGVWRAWNAGFSGKLLGLHERLLGHFRGEEKSGLYEALDERLPKIAHRTQAVRAEHQEILGELSGIVESLAVLQSTFPMEPKVLDRAREVLLQIVRHEQKESDLIARAYLEDLGKLD